MSDFDGFQMTGHRDDVLDEIELIGWTPGPAGFTELTFSDDSMSLWVDYADPSQFCALRYPVGSDAVAPLLDALSGGHGDELSTAIDALGDEPRIVWHGAANSTAPASTLPDAVAPLELFENLTDMALPDSQLETLTRPELVEIADLVAYGIAGFELPDGLDPTRHPEVAIDEAVERLEAFFTSGAETAEVEAGIGDDTIDRLVDLLDEFVDKLGSPDAASINHIRGLSAAVAGLRRVPVPSVDATPPASAPTTTPIHQTEDRSDGPGPEGRFDVEARIAGLVEVTAHHATIHGPELSVQIGHSEDSFAKGIPDPGKGNAACWLRVHRRLDSNQQITRAPLLVAMAPFVPSGTDTMVAVALLPTDVVASELIAEVTGRPADQWRDEPEQLIRYAVTMGQSAARLDRSGGDDASRERWHTTSTAWSEAGDERRSRLAADYADGGVDAPLSSLPQTPRKRRPSRMRVRSPDRP